jgi:outer membrane protein assembly factor BamB
VIDFGVPIIDNFYRAMIMKKAATDCTRIQGGVIMTLSSRLPKVAGAVLLVVGIGMTTGCTSNFEKIWEFGTSSPLYSTPLAVENLVVFGSESGVLHAVDRNGRTRWQFQTASSGIFAHPQTDGTLIFFGATNQTFYAVDLNGQLRWKFITRDRIKSDPMVADGVVYLSSYDGHVYALSAESGKKQWQFPADAAKGGEAKADAASTPTLSPGSFSYAQPVISEGVLYIGNLDGNMYALNVADGSLKWVFKAGEGITSTAWVEKGTVYFGSKDDQVYAIDAATGVKVKWKFKTGGDVLSSPRIVDGVLFIGSNDGNLYALDPDSGKEKCHFTAKGPVIAYPVFYQDLAIFGAGQGDGSVYAINRADCQQVWSFKTNYKIESDPILDGDRLYVTSGDQKLYAFKINRKAPQ